MRNLAILAVLVGLSFSTLTAATTALAAEVPDCPAYTLRNQNDGDPGNLAINNDEVAGWKHSTANQFHGRAHVQGVITEVYPDRNGHEHFAISIGNNETLEVVYNQEFGAVPATRVGMLVEACGDYITSTAASPGPNGQVYPASPGGAIVHWVHFAPRRSGHHSGYLVVDGVLTGQGGRQKGRMNYRMLEGSFGR
jgi:hypothetical protein